MVSRGAGRRPPTENVAVDMAFVDAVAADLARVQRLARILTGDVTLAEDLVAEALARTLPLWRAGRVDDVPAYVRRVVANLASHQWRRRALARRRDHRALDWLMSPRDASAETVERDRTLRAVMNLPPRRRVVVALRFYDDLSEPRIAEVLGLSVGTVKSQLSRAMTQLRAELEHEELS